jgi:hypothetical protein
MMDLIAIKQDDGPLPLYMHTVYRILREMRLQQQEFGETFRYNLFKTKIMASGLTPAQLGPLNQRLETLESFLSTAQGEGSTLVKKQRKVIPNLGTDWDPKVCRLLNFCTIADCFRLAVLL